MRDGVNLKTMTEFFFLPHSTAYLANIMLNPYGFISNRLGML